MHELPKDLTNSLRSFRGSIYGNRRKSGHNATTEGVDLEKGPEDYGDEQQDGELNKTESSLILHPTRSTRNMQQSHDDRDDGIERKDQVLRFEDDSRSAARPQVDTNFQAVKKQPSQTPQTPAKRSVYHGQPVRDLDPAADRLDNDLTPLTHEDFYDLMGVNPPTGTKDSIGQLARPHGLYSKMVKSMRYTNTKYRVFAIAVYVFLVLQLIISAVFIILGALTHLDTHITIAVLGAVATVIAGGLALMQGQGLPNRLRVSRDSLQNVVFEADELYWDMRSGRRVLYKDIKKIREDYLRVLEEERNNHPDAWNKSTDRMAQGTGGGGRAKK